MQNWCHLALSTGERLEPQLRKFSTLGLNRFFDQVNFANTWGQSYSKPHQRAFESQAVFGYQKHIDARHLGKLIRVLRKCVDVAQTARPATRQTRITVRLQPSLRLEQEYG